MTVIYLVSIILFILIVATFWPPSKKIKFKLKTPYSVNDMEFVATIDVLFGASLRAGNRILPLHNGERFFPAMLEAIAGAKRSITLETFIYWSGDIGEKFTDLLAERAKNGVKVHVLLDWIGSRRFDSSLLSKMEGAGVLVHYYHPAQWFNVPRLNRRTHRKILVIDGEVGFIGGAGIADEWDGDGLQANKWRDTHYRVEGPVVAQLQAAFADNWMQTRPDILHGKDYFPAKVGQSIESGEGTHLAQVFTSSSKEGSSSARLMFLYSISAARKSICISSAYFIPDRQTTKELIKAQKRGVRVRVLVPSTKTDSLIVRKASVATWGKLLRNGIELYCYQPAMLHNKSLVVDGIWTSIGSANFDPRSFRLNDEVNLNVYDPDFADTMLDQFMLDISRSCPLTYKEWKSRPLLERATDQFCALFKSQF